MPTKTLENNNDPTSLTDPVNSDVPEGHSDCSEDSEDNASDHSVSSSGPDSLICSDLTVSDDDDLVSESSSQGLTLNAPEVALTPPSSPNDQQGPSTPTDQGINHRDALQCGCQAPKKEPYQHHTRKCGLAARDLWKNGDLCPSDDEKTVYGSAAGDSNDESEWEAFPQSTVPATQMSAASSSSFSSSSPSSSPSAQPLTFSALQQLQDVLAQFGNSPAASSSSSAPEADTISVYIDEEDSPIDALGVSTQNATDPVVLNHTATFVGLIGYTPATPGSC